MEAWDESIKTYGASLTSDGWTSAARRDYINTMVVTNKGAYFHGSIDTSDVVTPQGKDAAYVAAHLIEVIKKKGCKNIVSIVTDGASVMKAAWAIVKKEFPHIVTTWCAAHVINLLLADIGRMAFFTTEIETVRDIVKFVNNHQWTRNYFRSKRGVVLSRQKKKRLLVCVMHAFAFFYLGLRLTIFCLNVCSTVGLLLPNETRFATNFIMLKRFVDCMPALQDMANSMAFAQYLRNQKAEIQEKGRKMRETVNSPDICGKINAFLDIFGPLVNAMRVADSDIPAAGKFYMCMFNAREQLEKILEDANSDGALRKTDVQEVRLKMFFFPVCLSCISMHAHMCTLCTPFSVYDCACIYACIHARLYVKCHL